MRKACLQRLLCCVISVALGADALPEDEECSMLQKRHEEQAARGGGTCPSAPKALSVAELQGQDIKISDGGACWDIKPGVSISQSYGAPSDCSTADYKYLIGNYVDSTGEKQNYKDGSSDGCPDGKARSGTLVVYSIADPPIKEASLSVKEDEAHKCTYQLTLLLPAQTTSSAISTLALHDEKQQHRQAPSCNSRAGDSRPGSESQLSRKCFPTFMDDQDVSMYFMNYRMSMGSIHQGIGWRSSCIKSFTLTKGASSNPANRVQDAADGVKASDAAACEDVCRGFKNCQAFVFDEASACSLNCFPLAEATGSAEKSGFTYGLAERYDSCSEIEGAVGFGAYQFGADGTLLPSKVDSATGEVTWDDAALAVSLQTDQNGWASYWTDAAGIGKFKGSLLNAWFDWVSVPSDNRQDLSPIEEGDTNYVALAAEYNFYGAVQSGSLLYSGQQVYIPATSCGDFVFSNFKYFSQYHNVNFAVVQNQPGCFGYGCSQITSLTHQQINFISSSVPTLIGETAGTDCAAYWDWLSQCLVVLKDGADWDKVKDAIVKGITGYYSVYSKACTYKNKKWYATPMSINILNSFSWSATNTFKCEKGWFDCKGDLQCKVGGACLEGEAFWTPAVSAAVKTTQLVQTPCNETERPLTKEEIEELAQRITNNGKRHVEADPSFYGHWNYMNGVIMPQKPTGGGPTRQESPEVLAPW